MWRRFLPKRKRNQQVVDPQSSPADVASYNNRHDEAQRLREQLLSRTPGAALAQQQMDLHPRGYHHREKRLYELIDFNDTFVSLALATPYRDLSGFAESLYKDMTAYCQRLRTPMFSEQQYEAIVRGLGREIAVYRSAQYKGFGVQMTSRTEDAFGIDLIITQPETGKILNIDCKTPPSFRHRLEDLARDGRIAGDDVLRADEQGFITVQQHRGQESVPVTLFCILPDRLGEIHNFTFDEPDRLEAMLTKMFATDGTHPSQ